MPRAPRGLLKPAPFSKADEERRQARLDESIAQRILDGAPHWAQQARVDPYNGQITHYIDIAGNAIAPETERSAGFSQNMGYPRRVPEAYLPPGALEPKPTPKPGAGPPSVAEDLINQVDLARLRIVKDLKREQMVTSDQPRTPAQQQLDKFQADRGERTSFKVSSSATAVKAKLVPPVKVSAYRSGPAVKASTPVQPVKVSARQRAQNSLTTNLASRGLGDEDVSTSAPDLDR